MKTFQSLVKEKSTFGLRNYEAVKERYNGKWNKYTLTNYNTDWLAESIVQRIVNDYYRFDFYREQIRIVKEAKQSNKGVRSALNRLKTWINQVTFDYNAELFDNAPKSTRHKYATKLYLDHYKAINTAMKDAFITLLNDYI